MTPTLSRTTTDLAGLLGSVDALGDVELSSLVHGLTALRSTVDALWLEAVAAVERRQLGRRSGARDTATWLAGVAGERVGSARRDVELASALQQAPIVAEAIASGAVSRTKAALLADAAALPDDVQRSLVRDAVDATVGQVVNAVRQARLEHGDATPRVEPSCTITRSADRAKLEATVDLVGAEYLDVALDAMAEALKLPADVPYPQRRAAALVGLARFYLDRADSPPTTRYGRPHVLVLVDVEVLEARCGGSATLASGAVVTGEQARQLATDAFISRAIVRGRSEVLDLGRSTRSVSPALAKAVITRDRHCRFERCDAPPWACEVHHRVPWSHGGSTSLANLGLLCWHHHQVVHRRGPNLLEEGADGRWTLRCPATRPRAEAA